MNKKVKIVILSLLPVLALGFLAFRAFENSAAYYYTISEAKALEGQEQKLRIKGQLVEDSVDYDSSIPFRVCLTDQDCQIEVVYQGCFLTTSITPTR